MEELGAAVAGAELRSWNLRVPQGKLSQILGQHSQRKDRSAFPKKGPLSIPAIPFSPPFLPGIRSVSSPPDHVRDLQARGMADSHLDHPWEHLRRSPAPGPAGPGTLEGEQLLGDFWGFLEIPMPGGTLWIRVQRPESSSTPPRILKTSSKILFSIQK